MEEVPSAMDFIRAQGIMIVPLYFQGVEFGIKILGRHGVEKAIVWYFLKPWKEFNLTEKEGCIAETSEEILRCNAKNCTL